MKIANLDLGPHPVMLAPMEDVTDPSFRLICREMGASLVYTEFVSAEALIRNINSTTRKLFTDSRERPVAIQIYGRDPEAMVSAAKIVEAAQPDLLPSRKWPAKAPELECCATYPRCSPSQRPWSRPSRSRLR